MPTIGRQSHQEDTVGHVPFDNINSARDFARGVNRRQQRVVPIEPRPIIQASIAQRVFIYNVSPIRYVQPMNTYGDFTILPVCDQKDPNIKDKIFKGNVGPALMIEGLPKEYIPQERQMLAQYHQPLIGMGREDDRPGYDFALEVVGAGKNSRADNDLRLRGVFISEWAEAYDAVMPDGKTLVKDNQGRNVTRFRGLSRPGKDAGKEAWDGYNTFQSQVKAAETAFWRYCDQVCADANMYHSQGKFADIRTDQHFLYATLIGKTKDDCPWLMNVGGSAQTKRCIECQAIMEGSAYRCPNCKVLQISDEEYAEIVKSRNAKKMS